MRFLVILDTSCLEQRPSVGGVVPEFTLGRRLEICEIAAQLVVRVNLIQRILIAEELILSEANIIPFRIEFIGLFRRKVLTPTSRVVPMVML